MKPSDLTRPQRRSLLILVGCLSIFLGAAAGAVSLYYILLLIGFSQPFWKLFYITGPIAPFILALGLLKPETTYFVSKEFGDECMKCVPVIKDLWRKE